MNGGISINGACVIGIVSLSGIGASFLIAVFLLTRNLTVVGLGLLFLLLVFICIALFVAFLRRKLVLFSDNLCQRRYVEWSSSTAGLRGRKPVL